MATLTSPTLQNLISSVRRMLNQPEPTNSTWQDSELTDYLNEGVRLYFLECVQANEGYFTTTTTLNIASGVETVALPTDCFQVKALYKAVTDGYILLSYNNNMSSGYSSQGGSAGDTYLPYYYFQGNNLVLRPTPQGAQTAGLKLDYIQFPDNMIWGGDSMTSQVSPVFKQLIEMYAVYKAKLKESMVNGVTMHKVPEENLAALYASFKNAISTRSKNPVYVTPFNPEVE